MSNLKFSYGEHEFTSPAPSSGHVKLYTVPEAYSEDSLYLATWANGELEPLPACAIGDATLLAHLETSQEGQCKPIYLAEGVEYAQV